MLFVLWLCKAFQPLAQGVAMYDSRSQLLRTSVAPCKAALHMHGSPVSLWGPTSMHVLHTKVLQ